MRKSFHIVLLSILLFSPRSMAQWKRSIPTPKYDPLVPEYEVPFPRPLHDALDTLTVYIIGDVMMHSTQFTKDHKVFFSNIAPKMRGADICIANMEFTLAGPPYTGYPAFSSPEYIADYMADDCGTDVFLTANNHILDKGTKGIRRTLEIYDRLADSLGIKHTGSALDEKQRSENYPLILNRKGFRIAIINITYGNNLGPQDKWPMVNNMKEDDVHEAFVRAKEQDAEFIIAIPHWGVEYQLRHSSQQERWANWLVDEGADVVVGGHPHVVQDTTHIKGVPVFYSLGNAVSNMSIENSRLELAVTLRFVVNRANGEKEMLEPELDFMWCTLPGKLTDSYATIYVKEWANRKDDWLIPSDYENMIETYGRVKAATGIED